MYIYVNENVTFLLIMDTYKTRVRNRTNTNFNIIFLKYINDYAKMQ